MIQGVKCVQRVQVSQLLPFARQILATTFPRQVFNALRQLRPLFAFPSPVEVAKLNGTTHMGALYVLLRLVQPPVQVLEKVRLLLASLLSTDNAKLSREKNLPSLSSKT